MPVPTAAVPKPGKTAEGDAIALLKADHKKVTALFQAYERAKKNKDMKSEVAEQICEELTIHAAIEEEIFYPAARAALNAGASDLLDEAEVEHGSIKSLIAGIQEALDDDGADEKTDAKVVVLREYVNHHVKEEESKLFPKLKKTDLDLDDIGSSLRTRKEELLGELA
jgi:hemerythrin-like domain-containing protein